MSDVEYLNCSNRVITVLHAKDVWWSYRM